MSPSPVNCLQHSFLDVGGGHDSLIEPEVGIRRSEVASALNMAVAMPA